MEKTLFEIPTRNEIEITDDSKDLAEFYNINGMCYYNLKKYDEAMHYFQLAIENNPDHFLYYNNKAETLIEQKKLDEAISYFKISIKRAPEKLDPGFIHPKIELAKLFISLKKYDEAYELDDNDGNIFKLILSDIIKYGGECKKCGICCRSIYLYYNGEIITDEHQFEELCIKKPATFKMWEPFRKWDDTLSFCCSRISDNNTCSKYEERPAICREYPNILNLSMKPGCGFFLFIDLKPNTINNIKLLIKIGNAALDRDLYDEWIKIMNNQVIDESLLVNDFYNENSNNSTNFLCDREPSLFVAAKPT